MSASAVVFAYHDVGVRGLAVLLAHGVEVPLVVTHADDPEEKPWFASVERFARDRGLAVATPAAPDGVMVPLTAAAPDFIFSFYYRRMLPAGVLAAARRGAYNLHGSLLPKFRGRAPVNWAIVHGERETGATLHEMTDKPDAGAIVDQMAVPILPDDLAVDVFRKVTVAAEVVLDRTLPALLAGRAATRPQDPSQGSYHGARRPADGRIDWSRPARAVHDLVRAVAPPYPGAFTETPRGRLEVLRTRVLEEPGTASGARGEPLLRAEGARLVARCADGGALEIREARLGGAPFTAADLGAQSIPLGRAP